MNEIRKYFESIVELTQSDWQVFSSKLVCKEISKKTCLLKKGQIERYLSFIEKGIIRFYIRGESEDKTFSFAFANNFVSAYDSFIAQQPCAYYVETLTDATLWSINYQDLQYVYEETGSGNKIGRFASEDLFLKKSKRELSLLHDTAEERYLKLFSEQPHLLQQIPLKYIASYIGITPQALSRIRKRIS
jgi:CRP-like cAMP-binding protein